MKILTITGTRPELIRLSLIIKKLDELTDHVLVYTNQNYDPNLSTIFFEELNIRQPDYYFGQPQKPKNEFLDSSLTEIEREIINSDPSFERTIEKPKGTFGKFFSESIIKFEEIIFKEKPDKILILGDTNSGLLSIVAEKHNIPIFHMEAGNRCYDKRVPEEANRRIIDSISKYNLPYTENSKQNLLNEGYHKNFVFKTGNPIFEVLTYNSSKIDNSLILSELGIDKEKYILCTLHRSENVDDFNTLRNIILAFNEISNTLPIILPLHPRTKNKIDVFNLSLSEDIIVTNPLGFFDFVKLEKNAKIVISDSGTVQEECCIFGVPSLTIRESTERQETIECGSNILCGTKERDIIEAFNVVMKRKNKWYVPDDYLVENVSDTVINILVGK